MAHYGTAVAAIGILRTPHGLVVNAMAIRKMGYLRDSSRPLRLCGSTCALVMTTIPGSL
jgi:hypothetical protein